MPFYLHAKGSTPTDGTAYDTRDAALTAMQSNGTRTLTVTYVCDYSDFERWTERECERFSSGTYIQVPWYRHVCNFASYRKTWNTPESSTYHYAHLSLTDPGMVAYTPSDDHGHSNRQVRCTPGRYLEKFAPDYRASHAEWIAACAVDKYKLNFATSADDIERVYQNGPNSCMRGRDHSFSSDQHPCRVYGDSDLAIAYHGDIDKASSRAICWPERKLYGRTYGATDVLEQLLRLAGYSPGSMNGARIHAIRSRGVWLMPYIDNADSVYLVNRRSNPLSGKSRYFVIGYSDSGGERHDCTGTNGLTAEADYRECDECGNEYNASDEGGDGLCGACYDRPCCHHCGGRIASGDEHDTTSGNTYCEHCYESTSRECQHCSTSWHEDDLTLTQRRARTAYRNHQSEQHRRIINSYCNNCYLAVRICETHGTHWHPESDDAPDDLTAMHCECGMELPSPVALLAGFARAHYRTTLLPSVLYVRAASAAPGDAYYSVVARFESPTSDRIVYDAYIHYGSNCADTGISAALYYSEQRTNPFALGISRGRYVAIPKPQTQTVEAN